MLVIFVFFFQNPYSGTWTRTREPGPVLGNLYVLILFILDPYSGTWTRTRELPVLLYVLRFLSTGPIDAWLFCHVPWVIGFESGLKKIDIRSRSWPNISVKIFQD